MSRDTPGAAAGVPPPTSRRSGARNYEPLEKKYTSAGLAARPGRLSGNRRSARPGIMRRAFRIPRGGGGGGCGGYRAP